jgi:hypothetical protein
VPFATLGGAAGWLWRDVLLSRFEGGAIAGLLAAILLLPACQLMIAAQRRADEARPGSILARAEQRAVYALVAFGLVILSALTFPDWMSTTRELVRPAHDALVVAALAGAIGLAILLADLAASRRLARIQREIAIDEGPATSVDFGLGDEEALRVEPGAAYREGGRVVATALGDPYRAQATLQRGVRRGVILVALSELVAIGQGVARDPVTVAAFEAERCDRGTIQVCRRAALLTERAGEPDEESTRLHQRACDGGEAESCLAVYLLARRNTP